MPIRVGGVNFPRIHRGNDNNIAMALAIATGIKDTREVTRSWNEAIIDRFGGLIVFRSSAMVQPGEFKIDDLEVWGASDDGIHFSSLICGHDDEKAAAAAKVLAMFRFGDETELLSEIAQGGDRACYNFRK